MQPLIRGWCHSHVGILTCAALLLVSVAFAGEAKEGEPPARTTEELRKAIAKVLK